MIIYKRKVRNSKVKLRKISIILILALCLSIVPVTAFASSAVITLNSIASVQPGGSVVISGTSTLGEVNIEILRPGNSVYDYQIVKVIDGTFLYSFTLSPNDLAGSYKVIAGQADQVDTKDLVVTVPTATPIFYPAAGTYTTAQSVTITSATAGSTIRYTLDGSTPTDQSLLYNGAISVTATQTLKAIAINTDMTNSSVATALYTIDTSAIVLPATVATPIFNPAAGTYTTAQTVTITTATSDVSIHYTTDGSTPTASSTLYSTPISVATTITLKAIAIKSGMTDSAVATALYTINIAGTITGPSGPSGPPAPPTQTPAPNGNPVTPAKSNAEPVGVDTSKNIIKSTTAADGHKTNTVTQDDTTLTDALAKAAKQDNHGDAPIVSITFNNPAGEAVVFNISSSVLAAAALNAPNTIISLQTNEGEYSLPLNIIDFAAVGQSLGTTGANISIQVNISTIATDINDKIKVSAQDIATSQLGTAIEFSITAVGNGKSIELNNFGSTYVDRNVVLAIPVNETHATVVLYDPTTGQLSFVPAVFEKQANGSTKVTFKRNGNSIYTVLSSTKTFNDVSKHWAKADIELLASKLVVKGATDTSFAPDSNITRAEFASLLVRSLGLTPDAASATFEDVKSSDWFAGTVGAAVKAKLVSGFNDNSFKPNDTITREQMAVMVSRAISAAGKKVTESVATTDALAKFNDKSSISSWAHVAVAQSVDAKIISGMTDNTFDPSANATRAQAVVMLKRLLEYTDFIN